MNRNANRVALAIARHASDLTFSKLWVARAIARQLIQIH